MDSSDQHVPTAEGLPEPAASAEQQQSAADEQPKVNFEEQYAVLLSEVSSLRDQCLRAQAELENVRRRSQEEVTKARLFGIEKLARELLPVYDGLEMALRADGQTLDTLRDGVEMTQKQFQKFFSAINVTEIDPVHEKFDPNVHQAMAIEESKEVPPDHVIRVLQKGYRLHDRLVRAALVVVSRA